MTVTLADPATSRTYDAERLAATMSTLIALSRTHDLRLPMGVRDVDAAGTHLEISVPDGRRDVACRWATILGLTIVSEHRQADGTVCVDAWTHANYGPVWLGWNYIRLSSNGCTPLPLPADRDPIAVAEQVHAEPLDDEDGMPEPCQPIGCDNGYHLSGCSYATTDQDGGAE